MKARASSWRNILSLATRNLSRFALVVALLPLAVDGQAAQNKPSELDTAIARANSGDVGARVVEVIARARAAQAIPALEVQFAHTTDLNTKTKIADGLVRLGDRDNTYWNFLLEQATLAVNSDMPEPFRDSQGNAIGKQVSPEFKAWAQTHNVDVSTAVMSWTYGLPSKVLLLGETGDPRGIPLLRRALQSQNLQIVVWASKGLALIQDKDSIPLIISAIRSGPPEFGPLIAESLIYFDDAQAQNAVDHYMSKDKATLDRAEKARGRGVFGW